MTFEITDNHLCGHCEAELKPYGLESNFCPECGVRLEYKGEA